MTDANAQANKRTLLAELRASRQGILDALSGVPPERYAEIGIGGWSIMDLLAHRIGWDFTNLKAAQEIQAGQLPGFYAYWDKDWRSYNALLVNLYKRAGPAEQLDSLQASHQRLVATLEALPADAFSADTGVQFKGVPVTIERLLRTQIEDERQHAEQIRDFARRTSR